MLPDNAEENIARLPYSIGGYDLDARVSNRNIISLIPNSTIVFRCGKNSTFWIWNLSSMMKRYGGNWRWTRIPRYKCHTSDIVELQANHLLQDLIRALVYSAGRSVGVSHSMQLSKGKVCFNSWHCVSLVYDLVEHTSQWITRHRQDDDSPCCLQSSQETSTHYFCWRLSAWHGSDFLHHVGMYNSHLQVAVILRQINYCLACSYLECNNCNERHWCMHCLKTYFVISEGILQSLLNTSYDMVRS